MSPLYFVVSDRVQGSDLSLWLDVTSFVAFLEMHDPIVAMAMGSSDLEVFGVSNVSAGSREEALRLVYCVSRDRDTGSSAINPAALPPFTIHQLCSPVAGVLEKREP